jgi:hypothetical protein
MRNGTETNRTTIAAPASHFIRALVAARGGSGENKQAGDSKQRRDAITTPFHGE